MRTTKPSERSFQVPRWLKNLGKVIALLFVLYISYLGLYYFILPKPIEKPTERTPLIGLINEARAEKDVAPLTADPTLDHTARLKAEDMAAKNYYGHDPNDRTQWDTIIKANRADSYVSENIARCYQSSEEEVEAWKLSSGHYRNLMDPQWKKYGTATVWDVESSCYITVNHFGI
ncbi:hypothetical protein B7Z00_04465 [Candidatus Saccharibacteria bacterium 32-50-10]|nr:MAG: hypothetical protein B7Z00_04465 [Candidatus Saccharibacteria bacterium 32-50-10]